MTLDEILDMWEKDNDIDQEETNLDKEIIRLKKLHPKYMKQFKLVSFLLNKREQELDKLYLEKFNFYKDGPTQLMTPEQRKLHPGTAILKSDTSYYINADPDYSTLALSVKNLKSSKEMLNKILNDINQHGYYLNNLIKARKYQNGEL